MVQRSPPPFPPAKPPATGAAGARLPAVPALMLTKAELRRLLDALEEGGQQSADRCVWMKLHAAWKLAASDDKRR